jgi:ubiquinone/menaquinone biosynthesis C-methylase UbiE
VTSSIVFDRAVSFYDQTRADPEAVRRAVTDSMIREAHLLPSSKILEIGIGTGRIGSPLLERGFSLVGVDLSAGMMNELKKKMASHRAQATLVQADANALPFPSASFDCAYAVHVYHLVAHWQNALGEAMRVINPGGVLLVSYHYRHPNSPNRRIRQQLAKLVEPFGVSLKRPGVQSNEEMAEEFERQGYTPQEVHVIEWKNPTTFQEILDGIEKRIFSETWAVPEEIMPRVIPALRAWTASEFGDLSQVCPEELRFDWMKVKRNASRFPL